MSSDVVFVCGSKWDVELYLKKIKYYLGLDFSVNKIMSALRINYPGTQPKNFLAIKITKWLLVSVIEADDRGSAVVCDVRGIFRIDWNYMCQQRDFRCDDEFSRSQILRLMTDNKVELSSCFDVVNLQVADRDAVMKVISEHHYSRPYFWFVSKKTGEFVASEISNIKFEGCGVCKYTVTNDSGDEEIVDELYL